MNYFKTLLFPLFLGLSITFNLLAEPEIKGSPNEIKNFLYPQENIVFLRAEAEEKLESNQALMSLKISSKSNKLTEAMNQNKQLKEQIIAILIEAGIDKNWIKSSRFNLSEQSNWIGQKNDYEVIHKIIITVYSENQMQILANLIDDFDAVELVNIEFENSIQDEFENQVRAKALEKVLQQKSFYEKKLGLTLVPISFHHSPTYYPLPLTKPIQASVQKINTANQSTIKNSDFNETDRAQNKSSFGEKIYRSFIEVEFQIQ